MAFTCSNGFEFTQVFYLVSGESILRIREGLELTKYS